VLDPAHAADQIVWHLASAASGPDEDLAGRLEHVGHTARRRGALAAAAHAFERASQLSETDQTRAERLLHMGEARWAGGATLASADLLRRVVRLAPDPITRARMVVSMGEAEVWSGGVGPAVELFDRHAAVTATLEPALCAQLRVQATGALILGADIERALAHAAAAVEAAERSGHPPMLFAAGAVQAAARLLGGDAGAEDVLDRVAEVALALLPAGGSGIEMAAQLAGFCSCITERWARTEELLGGVVRIGDDLGLLGLLTIATVVRADARFRCGRWSEAYADLTNVVTLAEATDERAALDFAGAYLARVEGARGLEEACRSRARAALDAASRLGMRSASLWARHALGLCELGAGRPETAAEHLDAVAAELRESGAGEPGILWWQADHVEALLACDRAEEAAEAAQRVQADAERTNRGWALAAAAWCGATTGTRSDPGAAFDEALARLGELGAAFERGRVLLARGRRRLEQGASPDGRRDLAEARTVFDRLGARAFAEQANAVLGASREQRQHTLASALSPAELRVALCVGTGATNKQAADQLFLSVKTVDYHLQNIYRKLSLTGRAQLAARVATETGPPR
jgi:DNA-binding CsgD family transcriptional regulator